MLFLSIVTRIEYVIKTVSVPFVTPEDCADLVDDICFAQREDSNIESFPPSQIVDKDDSYLESSTPLQKMAFTAAAVVLGLAMNL